MFIAIVGTRCSGKNTVKDYLVSKGFEWVALTDQGIDKVLCQVSFPSSSLLYDSGVVVYETSQGGTTLQTRVV